MSTPFAPEPKYFEHEKYKEFLSELVDDGFIVEFEKQDTEFKQAMFQDWLTLREAKEDAEDFKNLVHMRISMNTEEWNWFQAKLAEDEDNKLPNLRALGNHPPKGFKDLD